MRWPIVLPLMALAFAAQAQREKLVRYGLLIDRAEWAMNEGRHDMALATFDSAFALVPFMGTDHFYAAKNALLAGRDDRANALLVEGVENGLPLRQYYDSTMQAFLQSERAMPFLNTWDLMEQRYANRMDTAYIRALKVIGGGYRTVELPSGEIIDEKDTTAIDRFMQLVEERGFPTLWNVGQTVWTPHWLLLEQLKGYPNDPRWQRLIPRIQQAINNGGLPPDYLAMFQDMADHAAGRPQTYGTWLGTLREEDRILLPDKATLDKARASIGLGPIDHDMAKFHVDPTKVIFAERP